MKAVDVEQMISNVPVGTKLKLSFKPENDVSAEIYYLLGMARAGAVDISHSDKLFLLAVAESKNWGASNDRSVVVTTTLTFDIEWFVDRMARPLEKLEILDPSA